MNPVDRTEVPARAPSYLLEDSIKGWGLPVAIGVARRYDHRALELGVETRESERGQSPRGERP
jgi:hypothetical protein